MNLSRRQFLCRVVSAAASAPLWALAALPVRRCRPVITGSFWTYNARESERWGMTGWARELDRQAALGFKLLWIPNPQDGLVSGKPSVFSDLMDLCATRRMQVILGVGATPAWYQRLELKDELAFCARNIRAVAERFKDHPALRAWYIPHEIYMWWDAGDAYIQELYPGLVDRCKSAADRQVSVSPFFILDRDKIFGDFRFNEPEEYSQYWAKLIRRSGLDIVMLQDSGEHFSYVTNPMRRPFFEAMREACRVAGATLWGNVEVAEFECPSKEEFIRRYGRVHHSTVKKAPWRPVPITRLCEKLELASEYCENIVSWGYQEFCRSGHGSAAKRWRADYRRYRAHCE